MEEIIEEDSEDTQGRETTQTDTDESVDDDFELRQAADYVEHVEVSSRFFCLILIFLISGGFWPDAENSSHIATSHSRAH